MVRGSSPAPERTTCCSPGSLLDAAASKLEIPDNASLATTVPTATRRWSGGQSLQGAAGIPAMAGGVLSTLTTSVWGNSALPALSVANQVMVVAPSAVTTTDAWSPATSP